MNNLTQRLITGTIFVAVLIGAILWNYLSFGILFLAIAVLGIWEFYTLSDKVPAKPWRIYGTAVAAWIFFTFFIATWIPDYRILLTNIPLLFLPFLFELYTKSKTPFTNLAFTVLGWIYVSLPFALWNLIVVPAQHINQTTPPPVAETYKGKILLGYFIILWTSDSLAYVCGRLFGKHKLFERISPKKTWEGFIGGMIFTIGAGYIVSMFFTELSAIHWMVVSAIVVATGTLGDLTESMFKRSIDVKDSGKILPGHGGILDRFDAVLLSSPFVCSYLLIWGEL